jgi:hypothetical protein
MIMRRIIALLTSAVSLAIGYYAYTHFFGANANPTGQIPANPVINAAQDRLNQ